MRFSYSIMLIFISVVICAAESGPKIKDDFNKENKNHVAKNKINIIVNSQTFTVTLLDNETAKAFVELLPMTIKMKELNDNEKYVDLAIDLPANSSVPVKIQNGDLMLFGAKTLVLFYKDFSTTYSYTKLGAVDDTTGLTEALGEGNVSVSFEKEE